MGDGAVSSFVTGLMQVVVREVPPEDSRGPSESAFWAFSGRLAENSRLANQHQTRHPSHSARYS